MRAPTSTDTHATTSTPSPQHSTTPQNPQLGPPQTLNNLHLEGHRSALPGLWHRTVGGSDRGVLGQRRRRIVSRHPQDRTRQPSRLTKPPPRPPIDPVLDPSLVQPPPASFHDRTSATERMGGQLLPSHGRINQVSSTWGELHLLSCGGNAWRRPNGSVLCGTPPHERYKRPHQPAGVRSMFRNQRSRSIRYSPACSSTTTPSQKHQKKWSIPIRSIMTPTPTTETPYPTKPRRAHKHRSGGRVGDRPDRSPRRYVGPANILGGHRRSACAGLIPP